MHFVTDSTSCSGSIKAITSNMVIGNVSIRTGAFVTR